MAAEISGNLCIRVLVCQLKIGGDNGNANGLRGVLVYQSTQELVLDENNIQRVNCFC